LHILVHSGAILSAMLLLDILYNTAHMVTGIAGLRIYLLV